MNGFKFIMSSAILLSLFISSFGDFLYYEVDGYLEAEYLNGTRTGPLTGYVVVNNVPIIKDYHVSYQITDFYLSGGDLGFFRGDYGNIEYHQVDTYLEFSGYGLTTYLQYDNEELNWPWGVEMSVPKLRPNYFCYYTQWPSGLPSFNFSLTCLNYPSSIPETESTVVFLISLLSLPVASIATSKCVKKGQPQPAQR